MVIGSTFWGTLVLGPRHFYIQFVNFQCVEHSSNELLSIFISQDEDDSTVIDE